MTTPPQDLISTLDSYPRWFVTVCALAAAALMILVLGKLLKWTFYLVLIIMAVALVGLLVMLLFAPIHLPPV